jgi:predicted transcriptional regulator of viral defense system
MVRSGGIRRDTRELLELLHRLGGPFTVAEAEAALGLDRAHVRRLLPRLAEGGWLKRVRRGLYTPVPLEARVSGEWTEDLWVAASRVFAPCYIGGWSACEQWALTEQLFRTLLVFTTRRVRHREEEIQGMPIRLRVVPEHHMFGTTSVWRGQNRVLVSDPSRTVVDLLDDPAVGGGMSHIGRVIVEYSLSEHRNDRLLVEYGDRLGNRAIFKRLGYVVEALGLDAPDLIVACRTRRSAGIATLDPAVDRKGTIVRRWGLRVNVAITADVAES